VFLGVEFLRVELVSAASLLYFVGVFTVLSLCVKSLNSPRVFSM
jgi:hypothetical protein